MSRRRRHILDLLITQDDHSVAVHPVDPLLLSDHSFVVADCRCPPQLSAIPTMLRQVRNWHALDVDALDADLQQSELYRTPPVDPETAFSCYDQTLHLILDKQASIVTKQVFSGQSTAWYDGECRTMKTTTRQLERQYSRQRSADSPNAWRAQFQAQRKLFETKYTSYWLSTIDACRHNPRLL